MVSGTERVAREFLIVGLAIWKDTKVHRSEEHSTEVGRRQSRAEIECRGRKGNSRVNLAANCGSTVLFALLGTDTEYRFTLEELNRCDANRFESHWKSVQ